MRDIRQIILDPGKSVRCDFCDEDYTNSIESGGLIYMTKLACPKCASKAIKDAKEYGEEELIKATCPSYLSFRDWVYTLR